MIILKLKEGGIYIIVYLNLNSNMIILKSNAPFVEVSSTLAFKFQYDNT